MSINIPTCSVQSRSMSLTRIIIVVKIFLMVGTGATASDLLRSP